MQFVHRRREPNTSCFMTRIQTGFVVATTKKVPSSEKMTIVYYENHKAEDSL